MGYANSTPYEIIAAPFTAWFAVVGSTFPAVDANPAAPWTLLGSSGDLSYSDEGVTIEIPQKIDLFRALGEASARKAFRVEEDCKVSLTLADMTLEQFAHAVNRNSITTVAAGVGVAGTKTIGLSRGFSVDTVALLLRGPSPYGDNMTWQLEIARAAQTGNPKMSVSRNKVAMLALEWTSLVDTSAANASHRIGKIKAQTAPAS